MSCVREATAGAIEEAAARLRSGDLVAFPTETVYGIGASTLDAVALAKVYAIKERPQDNPLIAHVLDAASARRIVASWPETAERLAERFWPGPLTLVLARGADLPEIATVWRPTIAVRAPAHPVARDLLAAFGGPVSAPSANRSGHVSPTTASHVAADFPDADLLILDGGTCPAGIESTVLDLTEAVPRLLRPGGVTSEMLADALNTSIDATPVTGQAQSPGTSPRHYAPRVPTELVAGPDLEARLAAASAPVVALVFDPSRVPEPHRAIAMPSDAAAYASRLYLALRDAESGGASAILVERPASTDGLWTAVLDRLRRACG